MVQTKTNSTYLVAIKVPGHVVTASSVEIQQENGRSIRLHYLKERRTELALASTYPSQQAFPSYERQRNHQNSEDQLINFLQQIKDVTFGLFKVNSQVYLTAITNNIAEISWV